MSRHPTAAVDLERIHTAAHELIRPFAILALGEPVFARGFGNPVGLRFGRQSARPAQAPVAVLNCEYCKQPLHKKDLKFCGRQCYLRHSVEIRQPIKLAQARLVEMRAQGLDPGHGGEPRRHAEMAQTNNRLALNLTAYEWRTRRAVQGRMRRRGTVQEVEDENKTK